MENMDGPLNMPTSQNLDTNCRTLNYLHLEVYNGFFPSAKKKVRNSFSHWGPNSMIYITTFAILAVH